MLDWTDVTHRGLKDNEGLFPLGTCEISMPNW